MSESVFQTLKDLSLQQGKIVLATVHCPSSKTFHLFSRLLLLTAVRIPWWLLLGAVPIGRIHVST
jgi:hypothetical protein